MLNYKNILAIIPARGGSKGVINKNLRLLRGKPLIQYAIDYAKSTKYIDKIIVSTDSERIADVAISLGAEVVYRPNIISGDKALVMDAVRQVVFECENNYSYNPDIVVLLECTSPVKNVKEIEEAIEVLCAGKTDSVATFKETAISPHRLWDVKEQQVKPFMDGANPFLPRQDQPKGYQLTGQLYAITIEALKKDLLNPSFLVGRVFPIITKTEVVDIDNEMDLIIAEEVLKYIEKRNIDNENTLL